MAQLGTFIRKPLVGGILQQRKRGAAVQAVEALAKVRQARLGLNQLRQRQYQR